MITIKDPKDIEILRQGGKILAEIMTKLISRAKAGVKTDFLDELAEKLIIGRGGEPSFKNHRNYPEDKPFPTSICASINTQLVHTPARPGQILKTGDILTLDIGLKYPGKGKGYFTDMAVTFGIGRINQITKKLIKVTKKALALGISQVNPGNYISDISKAIQKYVESQGFSVVRQLVGHGVGYAVHEVPRIPNYFDSKEKPVELKPGMVLALEPMVNIGDWRIKTLADGWTVVTSDGSLCAHAEHTVVVTEKGAEVLTKI